MKTLEVKEINLTTPNIYNALSYKRGDGMYLVGDTTTVDNYTILVFVRNGMVTYIGEGIDLNFIKEKEPSVLTLNNNISEELLLKTISLFANKESYKDEN